MDENKIILVDIDNVLWDLLTPWVNWINWQQNLSVYPEDCVEWNIRTLFPTLKPEQIFGPLKEADFWNTVTPFTDAQEIIPEIQKHGYQVKIVSATSCSTGIIKIPKLLKAFPTIDKSDIILCEEKQFIRGKYMIDDNSKNLTEREFPILFNSFHNRFEVVPSYYKRASDWYDIYKIIVENK